MFSDDEELKLLNLFNNSFSHQQRLNTVKQWNHLSVVYPNKPFVELWLTAIADIRDGKSPWLA